MELHDAPETKKNWRLKIPQIISFIFLYNIISCLLQNGCTCTGNMIRVSSKRILWVFTPKGSQDSRVIICASMHPYTNETTGDISEKKLTSNDRKTHYTDKQ